MRPKRKRTIFLHDRREFATRLKEITGSGSRNLQLYEAAFIHRSASFSMADGTRLNNERLEFLGDAVLDAILSDYLFEKFPGATEGFMTKIRSRIVNRDVLNQLAISMGLDKILVSRINPPASTKNIYGDAFEAFIGAMFLDKGFRKTKKLFIRNVFNKYLDLKTIVNTDSDYKSLVFEWVQKHKTSLTFSHKEKYDFKLKKSVFSARLLIDDIEFGTGQGESKKEAEQEAAGKAWARLKDMPDIDPL